MGPVAYAHCALRSALRNNSDGLYSVCACRESCRARAVKQGCASPAQATLSCELRASLQQRPDDAERARPLMHTHTHPHTGAVAEPGFWLCVTYARGGRLMLCISVCISIDRRLRDVWPVHAYAGWVFFGALLGWI